MVRKSTVVHVAQRGISMRLPKRRFIPFVFSLVVTVAMTVTVHSQAFAIGIESVLFNFNAGGTEATGSFPHSTLIEDAHGNLYGTTTNGGSADQGTVFELSPPATSGGQWTETILWNFDNSGASHDGDQPWTWGPGLVMDSQGNLYGTTQAGGTYAEGTAWELSPPATAGGAWTETIIWNFGNPAITDGLDPTSGLTMDVNGNLYGTTLYGQSPTIGFGGTVYELSPPSGMSGTWTEKVIAQFEEGNGQYVNGFYPYAGVIGDGSGNLYGTTSAGGVNGIGINPGGTVFELSPAGGGTWTETVLWNFSASESDASDPMSGLLFDKMGNLYGTSALGGTSTDYAEENNGQGTVFELSPPGAGGGSWSEEVIWNFQDNGTDGFSPMAGVVIDPNGNLYGTTEYGGLYSDEPYLGGTAFKLSPPAMAGGTWGETILWNFGNLATNDASLPWASLLIDPIGNLYGTTLDGGSFGEGANGTVYEIANAPTTMTVASTLALGSSPVGDKITKNLTIKNTGHTNPLFLSATSSDLAEFSETATTCPTAGLAPLASCTITIGFTPNALGARSATLSIEDNTPTSQQHIALTGTGTVDMTVTPASYAFGSVKDGSKSVKAIVVHNFQTSSVSLSEGFTGANPGDFSVTGGTCTSTLAAKAVCTLIVTFAPTAVGTESATMTVTDSSDPLGPYPVSFTASATVPESLSATKLVFGNVYQTASKTLNLTVTNKATTGSITLTGTAIGGLNAGDFAVTGGTCGSSLAASSTCTYAVTFTPSTETAEAGTVAVGVAEDPNGGPPAVTLSGTGLSPLKVTPASSSFGTEADGHTSTARTITVTNDGGAAISLSENVGGTNPGDFAVTGGTCGASLAGGTSCTYQLKFTASIVGAESATLAVSGAGDTASPHNVSLSGTGS
jgi:uncharacterized repeat protein (TIGR03803 family)